MRMKFVKLCGEEYWYLWEEFDMKLRNFKGGWRTIDENSDEWMFSTIIEAENWHELYLKTGYNGMLELFPPRDAWLDREGNFYDGVAHELCAEKIIEIVYGWTDNDYVGSSADVLVANGWVKLTTSAMLPYYIEDGMYNCLSYDQVCAIREWANDYRVKLFEKEYWWAEN